MTTDDGLDEVMVEVLALVTETLAYEGDEDTVLAVACERTRQAIIAYRDAHTARTVERLVAALESEAVDEAVADIRSCADTRLMAYAAIDSAIDRLFVAWQAEANKIIAALHESA